MPSLADWLSCRAGRAGRKHLVMKVLVTGANGHLGQNLVTELVKRGHAVRASVRDARNTDKTRHLTELPGVEIVEADLFRPDTLRSAMAGIDVLCHGAAV